MEQSSNADIMPLTVGDGVSDNYSFLAFHKGEIRNINLNDFHGKWIVLFFYPADFTFVCPTELGDLADQYSEFQKEGVEIVSMSIDTVYAHKVWHETSPIIKKIEFPMGSDHLRYQVRRFGVFNEGGDGFAYRATVVINPDGAIQILEIHDSTIGRSATELLKKVKAAIYIHKNPGKVCPAGWKEGDEGMTPSTDMVGKI